LKADDVARYLRENPGFFESYADMLAEITVPHPHGGRAIPLSDRQMLSLREKSRALESRLTELLQIGEENDAIGEKMHRLSVALLSAPDLQSLLSVLYLHLREDFAVPHSALRIWGEAFRGAGDAAEFRPVGEQLKRYAASLSQPSVARAETPRPRAGSARGLRTFARWPTWPCATRSASECLRSAARTCCVSIPRWARCI